MDLHGHHSPCNDAVPGCPAAGERLGGGHRSHRVELQGTGAEGVDRQGTGTGPGRLLGLVRRGLMGGNADPPSTMRPSMAIKATRRRATKAVIDPS